MPTIPQEKTRPSTLAALALLLAAAAAGPTALALAAPEPETTLVGAASDRVRVLGVEEALLDFQARGPPDPQVPVLPGALQGIGPGSPIHVEVQGATGLCSTAFLVRRPGTDEHFLATAGHCLADSGAPPTTGLLNPAQVTQWVEVCYRDCTGYPETGTFVRLEPSPGYHPVGYAARGPDFGLIAIPASLNALLRPEVPRWGGPVEEGAAALGDPLLLYGHGNSVCNGCGVRRTVADQGRVGVAEGPGSYHVGATARGDSGGLVAVGEADEAGNVVAARAFGVIVGPWVREPQGFDSPLTVDPPRFRMVSFSGGLDAAQAVLGYRPELVAGEPGIRLP